MIKKISLTIATLALATNITSAADLTLNIENVRNDKGYILIGLFDDASAFNEQNEKLALFSIRVKANKAGTKFTIHGLEARSYALTIMHDENNNEKFDLDADQFPEEGFAYSNNVMIENPKNAFNDAAFTLKSQQMTQNLELVYIK